MLGSISFAPAFAVQQWIFKWLDPVFLHICESITLKQTDLYCKTIKTHVLQIETELYYYIMFWAIGIYITWQWRQNSFGPKSNFCPYRHFLGNALRYVYFGCLSFDVWSFTKIYKRNFEISLNFYKKDIKYAWIVLDLMLDLMQTNFLSEVPEPFL